MTAKAPSTHHQERQEAVATAMRRYLPHVVTWTPPQHGSPLRITLPEGFATQELLTWCQEQGLSLLLDHDQEARQISLHLPEAEMAPVEESIRQLGSAILEYMRLADRTQVSTAGYYAGP